MTPKSLMAFVFAIAFAVPAHAADSWCDFDVLGKTYFAHAAERDAFVKDAQPADHLDLYASLADKKLTAKLVRAGNQILLQQGAKLEDAKPAGDVLPGIKTARVLPPPPPPQAAQPRPQAAAQPAGSDIDAIVAVKGASFKDPERKNLVDALAYIQSNDSSLFDRLKAAAADPQKKAALSGLLDVAMGLPQNPDRIAVLRDRVPIVLGGAEVAPVVGGSVAGSGPPIQGADTGAADHAGVNKITEALVQDKPTTARPDAVNAIVKFVTDDANKFIADAVRTDQKQMKGLSAGLAEGLGKKFEEPKTATEIGLVYTILLSGDAAQAPAWLEKPESKAAITQVLRAYAKAHAIFLDKMKRWSAGAKDMIGEVKVGPWAGGSGGPGATSGQNTTIDQWMAAFLEDASKQAKAALNASKIDKGLVGRAVDQLGADWNGPANGVPGSGWGGPDSGSGVSLNFTAANFSTKEIYRDGARTHTFSVVLPGSNQPTPVTIAMKLKFRQYNGTMVPMVDIVDVSNDGASGPGSASHVYGQAFDLQAIPTSASDLRLQNDPNSYYDKDRYPIQYQLSRSPDDGSITLALDETHTMKVSPAELYSSYTDNVMHNAHTVITGGKQFQVVCQGGSNLQYAFFETKDGKLVDPNNPRPSLLSGAVKSVSVDATTHLPTETQQSSADVPLGNIGLKPDGTQQFYGLHWNQAQGYYDIVQEASEIPDPSAPPAGSGNNNNNNSSTGSTDNNNTSGPANNNNSAPPPPTNPGNQGSGTQVTTGASSAAADCKSKDAFSQNASPSDYAGKYRYWTGKDGDTYYCFFGDKFLHAGGFLAKIEEKDKELLLTVVMVAKGATAGITVIDPSKIANGHVDVTIPGKPDATTLDVSGVWVYRFDDAQLKARKTSNNAAQVSNVAWFQEAFLGTDPTKRDSLRVNFDADAKGRAAKAVEIIARYPTDQSGIFGGPQGEGNRKKLKKFLDIQIDKDTGALDADNPPFAAISLNLSDPVRQNGGDVVDYTSKTHSGVGLRWITPLSGDPFLEDPK